VQGDLTTDLAPRDVAAPFDAVLLDVPCTGLGNLARHPEIRWLRTEQDLHEHGPRQRALLERSLARVRPGGRLVYAVCSFEPEEGPELVESVAAAHGWTIDRARTYTPEDDTTEGFYVARLRR
jgi:16S rRNA (cytosine967-C5)-methyltransferase